MEVNERLLWDIIEKSKFGTSNCEEQYNKLVKLINELPDSCVLKLRNIWDKISLGYTRDYEFEKLHISNGGVVDGGDDTFYMDFGSWLVVQGEELYKDFKNKGYKAVIDYIRVNNIDRNEYTFECMVYAFQDVCKLKGIDYV